MDGTSLRASGSLIRRIRSAGGNELMDPDGQMVAEAATLSPSEGEDRHALSRPREEISVRLHFIRRLRGLS